jgi:hypothetical protein
VKEIGELTTTLAETSNRSTVVPSSLSLFNLMKEAICSSETPVLIRATLYHITEDGIVHNRLCENLKSYIALTGWAL